MSNVLSVLTAADLKKAYKNSYYFIAGAGEPLQEWVDGYNGLLAEEGIGEPKAWFKTSGAAVNRFAGSFLRYEVYFQEDVTCLLFPLNGLDAGKLALFKIRMQDRWFDDVIQNMRRH